MVGWKNGTEKVARPSPTSTHEAAQPRHAAASIASALRTSPKERETERATCGASALISQELKSHNAFVIGRPGRGICCGCDEAR
eukprot:1642195-Pleurochrysis_carterae.AAC.1